MKDQLKAPDSWGNLEYAFNTAKFIAILALIATIIGWVVVGIKLKEKPFVVTVGSDGKPEALTVSVLGITPEWVENFGSWVIKGYGCWAWDNYKEKIEDIRGYISAEVDLKLNETFKSMEKFIVDNKVVNKFKKEGIKITNAGSPYIVEIWGKNEMKGEGINKIEDIKYRLIVNKIKISAENPWGLKVEDIREVKNE